MTITSVSQWSTDQALNTDVAGNDITEGCSPAGINNAMRYMMAQIAATPLVTAAPFCVPDRTELKAIDTTKDTTAILTESGRAGNFFLADYATWSAVVTADTLEGYAIRSTFDTAKVWVRAPNFAAASPYEQDPLWYGAKNDNSADAQPAIACAVAVAYALGTVYSQGPIASVRLGSGNWKTGATISLPKGIKFHCDGNILYTPTSGPAFYIGSDTATQHYYFDFVIRGELRAINGNGSIPTSINSSGSTGIEIAKAQFSKFEIGGILAFTKYGFWGNSNHLDATDPFDGRHCQDNTIKIGLLAFNGAGMLVQSSDAALGACQVNDIDVQNSVANFRNFDFGIAGDINTSHNLVRINASDAPGAGGTALRVFGHENNFTVGYINGTTSFESGSYGNHFWVGRDASQITITDVGYQNVIHTNYGQYSPNAGSVARITSSDAGASAGPIYDLTRDSASPAANDVLGKIRMLGRNSSNSLMEYGVIQTEIPSPTAGGEYSRIGFGTYNAGTYAIRAYFYQGLAIGGVADQGAGTINTSGRHYHNGNQIPYRLEGTAIYDPASLADGVGATTTVTVTGAALGDIALASFSLDLQGITLTAWVSSANTVSVRFQNESGGVLDLESGTIKAWVLK